MPYISKEDRQPLSDRMMIPDGPGMLNYMFTDIAIEYLRQGENYQRYNDVIGALECCKLELYRRRIADYETAKIKVNGDVY